MRLLRRRRTSIQEPKVSQEARSGSPTTSETVLAEDEMKAEETANVATSIVHAENTTTDATTEQDHDSTIATAGEQRMDNTTETADIDTAAANNNDNIHNIRCNLDKDAIDDIARGLVFASLAITDDKMKTLKKVGKANPWQIEAVKMITGSEERAHQKLSQILQDDMNLQLDEHLDVSGITWDGHFLDTQGYIAHNDEIIVLAYRCTTSAFDWLTNFNSTSSAWEIEADHAKGYSGCCSGMDGLCCNTGDVYTPRVHTGFYNNFLASLPVIKQHIEPMLTPDQPPRKLYVTGHSLGAGVATLAACYFMLEFDWTMLPHSLVMVTAGSPRSCCPSMKEVIDERRRNMGDSVRLYRVVKGQDVVAALPPVLLGFAHIVPKVLIGDDATITQQVEHGLPSVDDDQLVEYDDDDNASRGISAVAGDLGRGVQLGELYKFPSTDSSTYSSSISCSDSKKYERMISKVPKRLRDHMPEL
jgi:predicted lipase